MKWRIVNWQLFFLSKYTSTRNDRSTDKPKKLEDYLDQDLDTEGPESNDEFNVIEERNYSDAQLTYRETPNPFDMLKSR